MKFDVNTITVHNAPMRWVRQAVAFYQKFGASEDPALHFKSDFVAVYPKLIEVATQMGLIVAPQTVATPTFSVAAGAYSENQNVPLLCSIVGATIRYTTDGSTPTATSAIYTTPIAVVGGASGVLVSTTIKAKAFKTGMTDSAVASATYDITLP